jgi:hypothetical protein
MAQTELGGHIPYCDWQYNLGLRWRCIAFQLLQQLVCFLNQLDFIICVFQGMLKRANGILPTLNMMFAQGFPVPGVCVFWFEFQGVIEAIERFNVRSHL